MINHDRWRDQQLNSFAGVQANAILAQEQVMLDFVTQFKDVTWKWQGNNTNFKNICQQLIKLDDSNAQGIILFGKSLLQLTTKMLANKIIDAIQDVDYAYVAVNRYELIGHDMDLVLPDTIEESIDAVMLHCHPGFKRLHSFAHVDGNHMVAAHPMDCYGLCKL